MKKTLLFIMALLLSVGVKAEVLWTGTATTGNWGGSEGQYAVVDKASFSSAVAGNIIKVTISNYNTTDATYWQYSLKQYENSWNVLPNFVDGNLTLSAENACHRLTAADVTALKENGLVIQGHYITITKVELLTTTDSETLYSDGTGVSTGNYENVVDLAWSNKGDFSTALMNDFVAVTYAATGDGEVRIANPDGWQAYNSTSQKSVTSGNSGVFVFAIPNATILEGIQHKGAIVYGKNITITKVELLKGTGRFDAVPLEIGEDGICTYSSSKNLDFSGISGATPYYVSATTTGSITLTPVETTRNWVGYVVKGTAGNYSIPVADSEPTWLDAFNNLIWTSDDNDVKVYRSVYGDYDEGGSRETQIKTKYRYILAKKGSEIGFHLLSTTYSEGGKPYHLLGAHKAFLEIATDITPTSGARIALVFDDDETTGITNNNRETITNNQFFDLQGRKVAQPTRGLYIVNGRKVIIK